MPPSADFANRDARRERRRRWSVGAATALRCRQQEEAMSKPSITRASAAPVLLGPSSAALAQENTANPVNTVDPAMNTTTADERTTNNVIAADPLATDPMATTTTDPMVADPM